MDNKIYFIKGEKMNNSMKDKIKNNNCEIFNEIYLKTKKFSLKELDELFDLANGSMQKVTKKQRFLTQPQILLLQAYYDIPSELFNNLDIKSKNVVERINLYREKQNKNRIVILNNYPLTLDVLKKYKYMYMYDNERKEVVERDVFVDKNQVKIYILKDNKKFINFEGNVFTTASSIVMVVENPVTGNSIIFKIQRNAIVGEVMPITYLGHRTVSNAETASIGFCSRHKVNNEDVIQVLNLDVKEFSDFSERKNEIVTRLKEYENNYFKNKSRE